jgi:hypothetical protein
MARSSCCPLLAAVISFLAGAALMSYLTCDGGDCFALENLEVARISSFPQFTSQVSAERLEIVERPVDVYGGPSWLEDEQTGDRPLSGINGAEAREPLTAPETLGVLHGDAVDPGIVLFGTGFYPDGRFHPNTGFDPYAPATPPVIPARKVALNIIDFGGIGDGTTVNTAAFEAAIAAASEVQDEGGALLLVPEGVWLTGCFNLTSHFTLFLESGAVLLASEVWLAVSLRAADCSFHAQSLEGALLPLVFKSGLHKLFTLSGSMIYSCVNSRQVVSVHGLIEVLCLSLRHPLPSSAEEIKLAGDQHTVVIISKQLLYQLTLKFSRLWFAGTL